jgi:hypothetical protein
LANADLQIFFITRLADAGLPSNVTVHQGDSSEIIAGNGHRIYLFPEIVYLSPSDEPVTKAP